MAQFLFAIISGTLVMCALYCYVNAGVNRRTNYKRRRP